MTTKINEGISYPTVNLAINKSRVKMYNKASDMPTFYLKKGEEFQIELFNPTRDTVLAKIKLNGNIISSGGLILRPGERVFLDRFIDVNKKFLFDTYEVSNSEEVRKAIEDNGDLEVEFFKERFLTNLIPRTPLTWSNDGWGNLNTNTFGGTTTGGYYHNTLTNDANFSSGIVTTSTTSTDVSFTSNSNSGIGELTLDGFDPSTTLRGSKKTKKRKSVETGRVEEGSVSNQKFKTVDKTFEMFPLMTYSYKILPISQKTVTTNELHHAFCTNCGLKNNTKNNFCPKCGNKL
jgi:hypothetical protein